jgi:hypothetical protein
MLTLKFVPMRAALLWGETLPWRLIEQRGRYRRGKLEQGRRQLLDEVGVQWNERSTLFSADLKENWAGLYQQLLQFKKQHGNCDVPIKWQENPQLGGWVSRQRQFKKSGKLLPERERMLNEIGFIFTRVSKQKEIPKIVSKDMIASWKKSFDELVAYKKTHGNCDVPMK